MLVQTVPVGFARLSKLAKFKSLFLYPNSCTFLPLLPASASLYLICAFLLPLPLCLCHLPLNSSNSPIARQSSPSEPQPLTKKSRAKSIADSIMDQVCTNRLWVVFLGPVFVINFHIVHKCCKHDLCNLHVLFLLLHPFLDASSHLYKRVCPLVGR